MASSSPASQESGDRSSLSAKRQALQIAVLGSSAAPPKPIPGPAPGQAPAPFRRVLPSSKVSAFARNPNWFDVKQLPTSHSTTLRSQPVKGHVPPLV